MAKRVIKSERAAVFIETAMVLPLFFILLGICVDLPRLLVIRQRLVGASRLLAEFRARSGEPAIEPSAVYRHFGMADYCSSSDLFFDEVQTRPTSLSKELGKIDFGLADAITDKLGLGGGFVKEMAKNAIKSFISSLLSAITGGELPAFFTDVFAADKFYSGRVTAQVKTILPAPFYRMFMNMEMKHGKYHLGPGRACYMPAMQVAQKPRQFTNLASVFGNFINGVKQWIPGSLMPDMPDG